MAVSALMIRVIECPFLALQSPSDATPRMTDFGRFSAPGSIIQVSPLGIVRPLSFEL